MIREDRRRRIEPADPGGEPVCHLTPEGARVRVAPIDRLLEAGGFESTERGYEARLPRSEDAWRLANTFADEEAACCPSLAFEIAEEGDAVVVRAGYPTV